MSWWRQFTMFWTLVMTKLTDKFLFCLVHCASWNKVTMTSFAFWFRMVNLLKTGLISLCLFDYTSKALLTTCFYSMRWLLCVLSTEWWCLLLCRLCRLFTIMTGYDTNLRLLLSKTTVILLPGNTNAITYRALKTDLNNMSWQLVGDNCNSTLTVNRKDGSGTFVLQNIDGRDLPCTSSSDISRPILSW